MTEAQAQAIKITDRIKSDIEDLNERLYSLQNDLGIVKGHQITRTKIRIQEVESTIEYLTSLVEEMEAIFDIAYKVVNTFEQEFLSPELNIPIVSYTDVLLRCDGEKKMNVRVKTKHKMSAMSTGDGRGIIGMLKHK